MYRKNIENKAKIKYGYKILRPICWVIGHSWVLLRENKRKHINLYHLYYLAGKNALCSRCNLLLEDSSGEPFFPEDEIIEYF